MKNRKKKPIHPALAWGRSFGPARDFDSLCWKYERQSENIHTYLYRMFRAKYDALRDQYGYSRNDWPLVHAEDFEINLAEIRPIIAEKWGKRFAHYTREYVDRAGEAVCQTVHDYHYDC